MRKRVLKLVISFETGLQVMALEAICTPEMGRIIPLPTQVSASCGLAWCADISQKEELKELMAKNNIFAQAYHEIELYF